MTIDHLTIERVEGLRPYGRRRYRVLSGTEVVGFVDSPGNRSLGADDWKSFDSQGRETSRYHRTRTHAIESLLRSW